MAREGGIFGFGIIAPNAPSKDALHQVVEHADAAASRARQAGNALDAALEIAEDLKRDPNPLTVGAQDGLRDHLHQGREHLEAALSAVRDALARVG